MGTELPSANGMSIKGPFTAIPELTDLNSRVVPVVVTSPQMLACVGTAFFIAPEGLAVTARHVIEEAIALCDRNSGAEIAVVWVGSGAGEAGVQEFLGGTIAVCQAAVDGNKSDLALLRTIRMVRSTGEPLDLPALMLSARLPRKGSTIFALGYTRFDIASDTANLDQRIVTIEQDFHFSAGEITHVYRDRRDAHLPTACFETSARFDSGMSGGPVFDEDGYVCGIVASCMQHENGYTSWASATPFVFTLGIRDNGRLTRVYEMAQSGLIQTDEHLTDMRLRERSDGNVDLEFAGGEDEPPAPHTS